MDRTLIPERGDIVKLVERPTGCTSRHYKLTIGSEYEVKEIFGCCVMTNTDDGGTGIYNRGRVTVVKKAKDRVINP